MMMRNLFWILGVLLLSACVNDDMEGIEQFMQAEKDSAKNIKIDEPIIFEAYEPFSYTGSNKRSPFQKPVSVADALRELASKAAFPDENRQKEFLEQFDIGSLNYVGLMSQGSTTWALIRDPDSKIHRVTVGGYLGKDHGRIKSIAEDKVVLLEIVPNGIDSWLERPFNLSLHGK